MTQMHSLPQDQRTNESAVMRGLKENTDPDWTERAIEFQITKL